MWEWTRSEVQHEAISSQSRSTIATAGFAVVTFTLISSVLFVARDIILARWFGLGNELDAFFIAMIVPMFLVSVMSIPSERSWCRLFWGSLRRGLVKRHSN